MKTFVVSKKDTDKIIQVLVKLWPAISIPRIKNIKVFEIEENKSILVVENLVGVQTIESIVVPFLSKTDILEKFPSVTVDLGSIKFICNGAKILRPGITKFDYFLKGDIVCVKEEKFGKYISVGIALENSLEAEKMQKGYVIDNLHYVGDKFWNSFKEISFKI